MRKILLELIIAFFAYNTIAQTGTTINVTTAGTLNTLFTKTQADTTTILKLTGDIDFRDIYFMRDSMLILEKLDLEEVNIVGPDADKMPDNSFYNFTTSTSKTSLKSIKLPTNLRSIGIRAFYGCNGLSGSLILPNSITVIENEAFRECSGFNGNLVLPDGITSIGNHAFYYCSNFSGNLNIPNSVKQIGYYAFCGCSGFTGDLLIPGSITIINDATFGACSGFSGNLIIPNSVRYIRMAAFNGCSGLDGRLTIPNSVTGIGLGAFEDCSGLTGNLTIPNSVTEIGMYAFKNCSGFTGSLIIPNPVTTLQYQTFLNCTGLTDLFISSSVDSITDEVFKGCSNLNKITVVDVNPLKLSVNTFDGIDKSVCELIVPAGSKPSYQLAYIWKDFTNIKDDAIFVSFNSQGGSGITDTIVNTDTFINTPIDPKRAGYTFDGWYKEADCINSWNFDTDKVTEKTTLFAKWNYSPNIIDLTDAGGLQAAITSAGLNPRTLDNIKITGNIDCRDIYFLRDSVPFLTLVDLELANIVAYGNSPANKLPDYSFYNPSGMDIKVSLNSIKLPNNITSIGEFTFYMCSGLRGNLNLPDRVTEIGSSAFRGCSGLSGSLIFPGSITSIGGEAFESCKGLNGNLTIPNSVTFIGGSAFGNCSGFTGNLTIPNSITSISFMAFSGCSGLSGNLFIPGSVDLIQFGAFSFCYNLTKITVGKPVPLLIDDFTFFTLDKSSCELVVPVGSLTAYQNADYWKDFMPISEAIFVFYDTQGGSVLADTIVNYNTGIPYPRVPAKIGYTFSGWYKESDCTNEWDFTTDIVHTNTTLYAKWEINSYTITFDTQGGTAVSNINANYNTTITTPAAPTRTGYTFEGWYKESVCTNTWNFTTDVVTADLTLYAKWGINSYTVTFDTQGGTAVSNINTNYNTTITTPAVPIKTGYVFDGWYKESVCTNAWNFTTDVVTADLTLYAKWVGLSSKNASSVNEFRLHPNPTNDIVILEGNNLQQVTIINPIGAIAMKVSFQADELKTINVSHLKPGIYIVYMRTIDNESKILKLVKD